MVHVVSYLIIELIVDLFGLLLKVPDVDFLKNDNSKKMKMTVNCFFFCKSSLYPQTPC